MKYWNYALYLGIFSSILLTLIIFMPATYSIFNRDRVIVGAGNLFPLMWIIWVLALSAFAINNVFADACYYKNNLRMSQLKKYLPSILGLPALISFVWCVYYWLKGHIKI